MSAIVGETVEKPLRKNSGDLHAQIIVKSARPTDRITTCTVRDVKTKQLMRTRTTVVQVVTLNDSHRYLEPNLRDRRAERTISSFAR